MERRGAHFLGLLASLTSLMGLIGLTELRADDPPPLPPQDLPPISDVGAPIPETETNPIPPPPEAEPLPVEKAEIPPAPPIKEAIPEAGTPAPTPTEQAQEPDPDLVTEPVAEATPTPTPTPTAAPEPPKPIEAEAKPEPRPEYKTSAYVRRKDRIPTYQLAKPQWAVEISGSLAALGRDDITDNEANSVPKGISLQIEYQPKFLQGGFGVIGLGPSAAVYPISSDQGLTDSPVSIWSYGGQIRYQARFFREQWLVPMVAYSLERLSYHITKLADPTGTINASGPIFGVWLNLNIFEPIQAQEFYTDSGIARSYLVAEIRDIKGSDPDVDISGQSYYFGIRIEF